MTYHNSERRGTMSELVGESSHIDNKQHNMSVKTDFHGKMYKQISCKTCISVMIKTGLVRYSPWRLETALTTALMLHGFFLNLVFEPERDILNLFQTTAFLVKMVF